MWLPLRAAGLQGSRVLHYLASFLSDVALASRAPRILHTSISLLTEMEVLGPRTWLDSFSCISVSLCYLFASFNEWGKTASPLESAGHNIAWLDQLGGEYSCWCAAFAGPSHIKERAHHSLSVKTVSCLQGTRWPLCIILVWLLFACWLLPPFPDLMSLLSLSDPMLNIENDMVKLFIQSK